MVAWTSSVRAVRARRRGEEGLMNWRHWLWLNWRYVRGDTPWDSGHSPPELESFLRAHPPGRALDLGCGTGTNTLRLEEAGWEVTGVDFAWLALYHARRKARRGQARRVRFVLDDVTRLRRVHGPFDLALDIGCFHALGEGKRAYLRRLDALLAEGGFWLLYGFLAPGGPGGIGVSRADLAALPTGWRLLWRQEGRDRRGRPSLWQLMQKNA